MSQMPSNSNRVLVMQWVYILCFIYMRAKITIFSAFIPWTCFRSPFLCDFIFFRTSFFRRITLLNYLDTTEQELKIEKHIQGPGCKCRVCTKLRRLECKYIVNLGTISEKFGLNSKDELDIWSFKLILTRQQEINCW